jgi:drug/metabolite transporter (DMT)-like permease
MSRLQANLILLLTAFIWGTTFVVQKLAVVDSGSSSASEDSTALGALTFTGIRFVMGALIILPFALREQRRSAGRRPLDRRDLLAFAACGIALCVGATTQQIGIIETTVSNAGFLTALYVPIVPILALLVFRRSPHWATWPAVACSGLGAFFLNGGALDGFNRGDIWVLAGTFFWATHVVVVGLAVGRSGSPLRLAFVQFLVCGVLSLGAGLFSEAQSLSAITNNSFEILYAGVLSVGVAYTLQVIGQGHTHPAAAAIIMSTEMLFAAIGGAWILDERLSVTQITGACLILSAILVVELMPLMGRGWAFLRANR